MHTRDTRVYSEVKPWPNGQTLLANISNFAFQACLPVWPSRQTLLDKHILLVNVFKTFQKRFLFVTNKNVCKANVSVVAKPTNIVLDKQNFKCLSNNVCPFGRVLTLKFLRALSTEFFPGVLPFH